VKPAATAADGHTTRSLTQRKHSMPDIDDRKIKAEIDEIVKKVNTIIKNIDELDPAKKEDEKQPKEE